MWYYKRAFSGISPIVVLKILNNPSPSKLKEDFNNIKKLKTMFLKFNKHKESNCLKEARKEFKDIYNNSKGNSVNAANYIMGMYGRMLGIPIFYSDKEKKDWNIVKKKFIEMKMNLCPVIRIRWNYVKTHKKDILDFLIGVENGMIPAGM